jgi:hypothetical protein
MDNLDASISEAELKERRLLEELAATREALKSLRKARALLRGEVVESPTPKRRRRKRSLMDEVEDVLKMHGELHVDQIVNILREQGFVDVQKQVLTSSLSRYVARGSRFRRVGANKFALIGE